MWLHVVEKEVVCATPGPRFGILPPYLRKKDVVLTYQVIVHVRCVTDYAPSDPSPSPSPPVSDDGDSGHDGNPERHHFSRGHDPRIQGFACHRGAIDGAPPQSGNGGLGEGAALGAARHVSQQVPPQHTITEPKLPETAPVEPTISDPANAGTPVESGAELALSTRAHQGGSGHFEFEFGSANSGQTDIGDQLASDPMVLEAELLSVRLSFKGTGHCDISVACPDMADQEGSNAARTTSS